MQHCLDICLSVGGCTVRVGAALQHDDATVDKGKKSNASSFGLVLLLQQLNGGGVVLLVLLQLLGINKCIDGSRLEWWCGTGDAYASQLEPCDCSCLSPLFLWLFLHHLFDSIWGCKTVFLLLLLLFTLIGHDLLPNAKERSGSVPSSQHSTSYTAASSRHLRHESAHASDMGSCRQMRRQHWLTDRGGIPITRDPRKVKPRLRRPFFCLLSIKSKDNKTNERNVFLLVTRPMQDMESKPIKYATPCGTRTRTDRWLVGLWDALTRFFLWQAVLQK